MTTARQDGNTPDVDDLREEIAQTRAELGETVEALAAKADVKARVHDSVDEAKARIKESAAEAKDKAKDKAQEVGERLRGGAREAGSAASSAGTVLADRAQETAVQVREDVRSRPIPYGVLIAGAALLVAVLVWRRRGR